jgi:streptogramin lyase/fibronectin type 3 domain-containing protein
VSSSDGVLRYSEATGAFVDAFVPQGAGGLVQSQGLAFGPDGSLYVSSQNTQSVLRFDGKTGAFLGPFVPTGAGGLELPMGLTFGPDGALYVSSFGTNSILRFDGKSGAFQGAFVPGSTRRLDGPTGLAFGPDGNLYVGSAGNNSVVRFDGRTGAYIDTVVPGTGIGIYGPIGPVFGPDGNLYAGNFYSNSIFRYEGRTGAPLGVFVSAGSGGLSGPTSMAFGPDGALYVASSDYDSVLRYDGTTGAFIDTFVPQGRGGLYSPTWLAFSPPAAPTALTASAASRSQINLRWTDNSDDENAFSVWRQSGGSVWVRIAVLAPNTTAFSDTGLSTAASYSYRVRATHGYYASVWSNESSAATFPMAPAAPTKLTGTARSTTQIDLSWTDNSSNETAFAVWRKSDTGDWQRVGVIIPNQTTYSDVGLSPNKSYTYRVRAINDGGASAWSNEVSTTTMASP